MDASALFLIFVLAFDFVVSIWNAYASGLTWALLRNQPGQWFAKVAAIAGLGLAFAGVTYATIVVLSYVAYVLGFLLLSEFLFLVYFDFLVFGAMIIGFGLVITAQSVAIAYRRRRFGDIAVAAWNVFSEVWDLTIYAEGFHDAAGAVSSRDSRDRINLYTVAAVAVGIGFLVTYLAFRHGVRRAEGAISASARQSEGESTGPRAGGYGGRHHLRNAILAGIVVIVVVVAAIAVLPYAVHAPQVNVRGINVWAPNNVCGLGTNPVYYAGFSDAPGGEDAFVLQVHNFNSTPCTVHGATTNTSGFGLSNVETPVNVLGNQNGSLNLTILLPAMSFDGWIDLVYA